MDIKLKEQIIVSQEKEIHFKLDINGKETYVSKYSKNDEFGVEGEVEIFKGKEFLSPEEQEEVLDFINEL